MYKDRGEGDGGGRGVEPEGAGRRGKKGGGGRRGKERRWGLGFVCWNMPQFAITAKCRFMCMTNVWKDLTKEKEQKQLYYFKKMAAAKMTTTETKYKG